MRDIKIGQKITQDDINLKLFIELEKIDTRMNWSIGIQASMGIATILIMLSVTKIL